MFSRNNVKFSEESKYFLKVTKKSFYISSCKNLPSTQSPLVKGDSSLILLVEEKNITMKTGFHRRCWSHVFGQDFTLCNFVLWNISNDPMLPFTIIASGRYVRV